MMVKITENEISEALKAMLAEYKDVSAMEELAVSQADMALRKADERIMSKLQSLLDGHAERRWRIGTMVDALRDRIGHMPAREEPMPRVATPRYRSDAPPTAVYAR